jgi:DNA helicase-2/ATP-dependent DNA helicase PcrA
MAGMEDGLFPGFMSMMSGDDSDDMEEERRLCYVGITRAKERLVMTAAKRRMLRGEMQYSSASRFIKEIPSKLFDNHSPSMYELGFAGKKQETFTPRYSGKTVATSYGSSYSNSSGNTSTSSYGSTSVSSYGSAYSSVRKSGVIKSAPSYKEGDRVSHRKFGEGTVISINDGGRDFEVSVNFDGVGVKKMFASFAKLEKL